MEEGVSVLARMSDAINRAFGPKLMRIFEPTNDFLASAYMPWARIVTVGFFVGTMVWVFVGLKRSYVNLEAPSKHVWHDLRFWTVISMLPHVIVYLYF